MRPPRERRPPPEAAPSGTYSELEQPRAYLDVLRVHHLDLVQRYLGTADLYTLDLFISGVANRSYYLVEGFLTAFDDWNVYVAAPLLRMQLDNLTRVSYLARAPSADDVAMEVLGGNEFRHMQTPDGRKLTDRKLVELAAPHHDWLPPVYEATSGWIHLSPFHITSSWKVTDDPGVGPGLVGRFPLDLHEVPKAALEELLGAMTKATEALFGYIELWESRKGLPPGEMRDL